MRTTSALLLFALALGCRSGATETDPAPEPAAATASAAARDLDRMLAEGWSVNDFPDVRWQDIDALLARADSTRALASFPTNPLSSQSQPRCSEGVMALWMVESVRLDVPLGFPSLNPLLLGGPEYGLRDWNLISERNHPAAAMAYRAWWDRVREQPVEERRADDPLAGTGIAWH